MIIGFYHNLQTRFIGFESKQKKIIHLLVLWDQWQCITVHLMNFDCNLRRMIQNKSQDNSDYSNYFGFFFCSPYFLVVYSSIEYWIESVINQAKLMNSWTSKRTLQMFLFFGFEQFEQNEIIEIRLNSFLFCFCFFHLDFGRTFDI